MSDRLTAGPAIRTPRRGSIPGGAVAAVVGPSALAASNVCFALVTADGQSDSTTGYLVVLRTHSLLVEVGSALGLLACILIVPAVWAVVGRLAEGRARLVSVGGWLMASGYVMGVALSVEALVAVSVAGSAESPAAYIDAVDNRTTVTAVALYAVFGLGALVGGLLLGVAMLRRPDVPRWSGIALVASEPVRVIGLLTGVGMLTAVASLLILAGFVGALRGPAPVGIVRTA